MFSHASYNACLFFCPFLTAPDFVAESLVCFVDFLHVSVNAVHFVLLHSLHFHMCSCSPWYWNGLVCFWAFNPFASLRRCQFSALLSSHWFSPIAVLNLLKCTVSVPISFCFGIHSVQYFSSCILNSRFLLLSDDLSPSNSEPDSVDRQQNLGRLHVWLFSLSLVSKVHPF